MCIDSCCAVAQDGPVESPLVLPSPTPLRRRLLYQCHALPVPSEAGDVICIE